MKPTTLRQRNLGIAEINHPAKIRFSNAVWGRPVFPAYEFLQYPERFREELYILFLKSDEYSVSFSCVVSSPFAIYTQLYANALYLNSGNNLEIYSKKGGYTRILASDSGLEDLEFLVD